jgi:transposase
VINDQVSQCILSALKVNPFITARSLVHILKNTCDLRVSPSTASRYVKRAGFSRKKAFQVVDHAHKPVDVLRFCNDFDAAKFVGDGIVSIDEGGFYIGDAPKYGYSPRGCRLQNRQSRTLRRRKLTLLLAVSRHGVVHFQIQEENCKKQDFLNFIRDMPQLSPRTTLLMDNIAFHHSREVIQAIQDRGWSKLHTLPYSPRLNPIEYVFRSCKACYRENAPPENDDAFDYVELLVGVVLSRPDCDASFRQVERTVDVALKTGGINFSGYDLKTVI